MLSWLPAFFAMKNAASSSGSPAHVPRVVYPPEQGQFFGFYAFSGGSSIFLPFFFFFNYFTVFLHFIWWSLWSFPFSHLSKI